MRAKNIIFDLGGVIEKISPELVVDNFKSLGMENSEDFFSLFRQSDTCSQFETGHITESEFLEYLVERCDRHTNTRLLVNAWCSNQLGVTRDIVDVIVQLKERGHSLYILSNTNSIHYNRILNTFASAYNFSFEQLFSNVFLSYEINERKPGKEIYQYVINQGIDPQESVYIDDLASNLTAPKELGFDTILHKKNAGIEYLLDELTQ